MPAIKSHKTDVKDGAWDGPGNVSKLRTGESKSYYAKMFAWQDPDGDPSTKSAYKFPHHFVNSDGDPGAASIKGCQAGIAVLNGSMGGSDIPDSDRRGVYNHLAKHLRDADIEPTELKFMAQEIERRTFTVQEIRASGEGEESKISGYAAVFNSLSENLGGFYERIKPGAFTKTLKEADIRGLFNHDPNHVLGRNTSGTLTLDEDDQGLAFEVEPPDTTWARDLMVSVRRNDINQMSFGFQTIRDKWESVGDQIVRTLLEVKLFDVSLVTFPAYPQTSASVRSAYEAYLETNPTAAPGQEPHPAGSDEETSAQVRLANLRRQLELVEKS